MESNGYVFADRDLHAEFARLEHQASFFDPVSRARLESLVPSAAAVRCLEIGVGTGSMTRWLAQRGCSVTGLDIADRFFPAIAGPGIELRQGDVRSARFDAEFDVVYARMVLHHLPEREQLVARFARFVKPGGHLLIEDPQFALATSIGGPPFERFYHDLAARMLDLGVDYDFGGRLPHLLQSAGLQHVDAGYSVPLAFKGSPGAAYLLDSLRTIRPVVLAQGWYREAELDEIEAQLNADDLLATAAPIVSCWGTKPD